MIRQLITLIIFLGLLSTNLPGQNYESYKKLKDTRITSHYLGFDKNITITVPFEWQKNIDRTFPLIIIFDRQNNRSHNYIINTIDYLTSNEQMPSSIIVSIESTQEHRYLETLHKATSEKGLALQNEKFLFEELIPLVEKEYKASSYRLFIGHSRYGYFTSSLLATRLNELNGVISVSPFFSQTNVNIIDSIGSLKKENFDSMKYYRFGIGGDFPTDFHQMDSLCRELQIPLFNAKGYLFPQAGHNVTPGLTVGISLYEIFEDWSGFQNIYFNNDVKDLTIIDSLKNEIAIIYGNRLEFSLGVLNGKGWYFYNEGQYQNAIEAWELLMKSYPNYSEGYLFILAAQIQLKEDYSKTVEKLKVSLMSSEIYSEEEKNEIMEELKEMTK